jgi:hypothetical protein
MSALHNALEEDSITAVTEALNDPELPNNWHTIVDDFGQTVLQCAAENGKTDILKLLVSRLPDKNLLNLR